MTIPLMECKQCKVNKPLNDFYKTKVICKPCYRAKQNVAYHCNTCNMDIRTSSKPKHFKSRSHNICQETGITNTRILPPHMTHKNNQNK